MMAAALALAGSTAQAAPGDGFVLTKWGHWRLAEGLRDIERARAAGASHISILVELCQPDRHASTLDWCSDNEDERGRRLTETFAGRRLLALVPALRARGLTFNFIPFVISQDGLRSRQFIDPRDRKAWFRAYGDRIEELADLAREQGARDFIVASELSLLFFRTAAWREVIARVRRHFPGELTISSVFWQYPLIGFWDALDSIGISAYFPLSLTGLLTPVPLLKLAWSIHKAHLLAFARLHRKPLTFVEVGYPALRSAARMPWGYRWNRHRLDLGLQQRCFEAFRAVWGRSRRLRAFQIWGLGEFNDGNPKGYSPLGKPAEQSVRKLFRDRSSKDDAGHLVSTQLDMSIE